MIRIRDNAINYCLAVAILMIYCAMNYLVIPEVADYEFFAYIFGGGILLYGIYYLALFVIQSITKAEKDNIALVLFYFITLEVILFFFLDGTLILSLFNHKSSELFLLFHLIPFLILIFKRILNYRKMNY